VPQSFDSIIARLKRLPRHVRQGTNSHGHLQLPMAVIEAPGEPFSSSHVFLRVERLAALDCVHYDETSTGYIIGAWNLGHSGYMIREATLLH
jgi:hypothetical protein